MTTSTSSRSARATTPKDDGLRVTGHSSASTSKPSKITSRSSGLKAAGSTIWYLTDRMGDVTKVTVPTGNSRASWSKTPSGDGQVRIYRTPGSAIYDFATDGVATIHSDRVTVESIGKAGKYLIEEAKQEAKRQAAIERKEKREQEVMEKAMKMVIEKHLDEDEARAEAEEITPWEVTPTEIGEDGVEIVFASKF